MRILAIPITSVAYSAITALHEDFLWVFVVLLFMRYTVLDEVNMAS